MVTRACHLSTCAKLDELHPTLPSLSLRSIFTLSSNLYLGLPVGHLQSAIPSKTSCTFLFSIISGAGGRKGECENCGVGKLHLKFEKHRILRANIQ